MKVCRTKNFDKAFLKLPDHIKTKTKKAIALMLTNFFHPSLHTKKIGGQKNIWEARVDYQYRFTFMLDNDTIVLRVIGNHDEVLKNP
ncbi:MAG: hypothetical protein HY265_07455 [Deltaproteobacteria bacterium]|nr:hypothetical protein [Deltaproteobacteria bacterium]